jgi:hypothetical protein
LGEIATCPNPLFQAFVVGRGTLTGENIVTKRSSKKSKSKKSNTQIQQAGPWLPSRGGMIALGIVSLLLVAWVTFQGMKVNDFGESLLWGLGFGASIWVIFVVVFAVNKFLRGR